MDWEQTLQQLEKLIRSSPENNRKALPQFLEVVERARTDDTLEAGKALWWLASMVDQRMGAKEARLLYIMALQKLETSLGTDSPLLAGVLHSIAHYLAERELYSEAEPHYRRIIALREKANQKQAAEMTDALRDFINCLRKQGRDEEADEIASEVGNRRN